MDPSGVGELVGLRAGDVIERDRKHYLRIVRRSQGRWRQGDKYRLVPIPRL